MVCSTGPGPGGELMEMGTSPTPKAVSMLNWPGRKRKGPPGIESERVYTSVVSFRDSTTWAKTGVHVWSTGWSTSMTVAVEIEEAQAGGLQAFEDHRTEPLHQLVAEGRIGVGFGS